MKLLVATLTALLATASVSACAAPPEEPSGRAAPSASPPAPSSPAPSSPTPTATTSPGDSDTRLPTILPPSRPPTTPSDAARPITVAGTVQQGVEAGCVVLVAGETQVSYLLLGSLVDRIDLGAEVKLRGLPVPGRIATTCQQGIPLQVHEILPS